MRSLSLLLLTLLVACGGSAASTSNGLPITSQISTDFAGTYMYKDGDCDISSLGTSFQIIQTSNSSQMTIANGGGTFTGQFVAADGQEGINFDELGCSIYFIRNQADLNDERNFAPGVNSEIGDLAAACEDESPEQTPCTLVYSK